MQKQNSLLSLFAERMRSTQVSKNGEGTCFDSEIMFRGSGVVEFGHRIHVEKWWKPDMGFWATIWSFLNFCLLWLCVAESLNSNT